MHRLDHAHHEGEEEGAKTMSTIPWKYRRRAMNVRDRAAQIHSDKPKPKVMAKKAPVKVLLKEGGHKTQPWTYQIDGIGPGPKTTALERYAARRSAWRGALRNLKASPSPLGGWLTLDFRTIIFTTQRKRK